MGKHSPAFLAIVEEAKQRIREITPTEVRALQERGGPLVFVDVREESEFAGDRCAGAIHLGKGVLERDVEERIPDRAAPIVLYCGGGFRSALAADALQRMGYTDVRSMAGGIRLWREQALPLEG